jgi:arylsulfatase A-like enzyme
VLLIVCDDLNDYITGIEGDVGHAQVITPNVEKFAKSGVSFRRAYSNNPVCAPSRTSFFYGIYHHTSKNLFWDDWKDHEVFLNSKSMMEFFRENGYHVAGSGKLNHFEDRTQWSEFKYLADYGPVAFDGEKATAHPSVPKPFYDIGPIDGSFGALDDVPYADDENDKSGWNLNRNWKLIPMRYNNEQDRDRTPDELNAEWAIDRLQKFAQDDTGQPFFLGVGFIRPHTPLHVPQRFFDLFPLDKLELPVIKEGDAEDCHYQEVFDQDVKGLRYFRLLKESYPTLEDGLKAFTQAYLASCAAVDENIGQVLDALDQSPFRDNTIVVITSDHGWQMGQKDFLFKNAPWEDAARVPFIVRAPGVSKAGGVAEHPISLIDLYPTLVDLCSLEGDTRKTEKGAPLDGFSVRPFLVDPETRVWDGPDAALTLVHADENAIVPQAKEDYNNPNAQHWTIRTERYRYIRYNNGMEELYDHNRDPHEWTNLADNPEFAEVKREHRIQLEKIAGLNFQ